MTYMIQVSAKRCRCIDEKGLHEHDHGFCGGRARGLGILILISFVDN